MDQVSCSRWIQVSAAELHGLWTDASFALFFSPSLSTDHAFVVSTFVVQEVPLDAAWTLKFVNTN